MMNSIAYVLLPSNLTVPIKMLIMYTWAKTTKGNKFILDQPVNTPSILQQPLNTPSFCLFFMQYLHFTSWTSGNSGLKQNIEQQLNKSSGRKLTLVLNEASILKAHHSKNNVVRKWSSRKCLKSRYSAFQCSL